MTAAQSQMRLPTAAAISAGFSAPVLDAQRTFRAVMNALAEPGTGHAVDAEGPRCPGFSVAMTAIALTLADFETRLWTDIGAAGDAAAYLRFHTGAPIVVEAKSAAFAFVTRPRDLPRLATFAQGTLEYPDTSATLVVDVESIDTTRGWALSGPGIAGTRRLTVSPVPDTLLPDLAANRAAFPCGIDIIFCAGTRIVALPRSIRVGGR
jgi:alpha-D-ribose 1-methylphosphonate 5-triphosphate synthase subunit PhnH